MLSRERVEILNPLQIFRDKLSLDFNKNQFHFHFKININSHFDEQNDLVRVQTGAKFNGRKGIHAIEFFIDDGAVWVLAGNRKSFIMNSIGGQHLHLF